MISIANLSKIFQTNNPEVLQNIISRIENLSESGGKTFEEVLREVISNLNKDLNIEQPKQQYTKRDDKTLLNNNKLAKNNIEGFTAENKNQKLELQSEALPELISEKNVEIKLNEPSEKGDIDNLGTKNSGLLPDTMNLQKSSFESEKVEMKNLSNHLHIQKKDKASETTDINTTQMQEQFNEVKDTVRYIQQSNEQKMYQSANEKRSKEQNYAFVKNQNELKNLTEKVENQTISEIVELIKGSLELKSVDEQPYDERTFERGHHYSGGFSSLKEQKQPQNLSTQSSDRKEMDGSVKKNVLKQHREYNGFEKISREQNKNGVVIKDENSVKLIDVTVTKELSTLKPIQTDESQYVNSKKVEGTKIQKSYVLSTERTAEFVMKNELPGLNFEKIPSKELKNQQFNKEVQLVNSANLHVTKIDEKADFRIAMKSTAKSEKFTVENAKTPIYKNIQVDTDSKGYGEVTTIINPKQNDLLTRKIEKNSKPENIFYEQILGIKQLVDILTNVKPNQTDLIVQNALVGAEKKSTNIVLNSNNQNRSIVKILNEIEQRLLARNSENSHKDVNDAQYEQSHDLVREIRVIGDLNILRRYNVTQQNKTKEDSIKISNSENSEKGVQYVHNVSIRNYWSTQDNQIREDLGEKSQDFPLQKHMGNNQLDLRKNTTEPSKNNLEVKSLQVEYREKIDTKSEERNILSDDKPKVSNKFIERLAELTYKNPDHKTEFVSNQQNGKYELVERLQASRNLEQIYERIREFATLNKVEERVQMKLVPENLGNLDVEMKKEGKQIILSFIAESEKVKEIIEKNIHVLRERLIDLDFDVRRIEVKVKEEDRYYEHEHNNHNSNQQEQNENKKKYTYKEVNQDDDERERNV